MRRLGITPNHFDSQVGRFLYNDQVMEYVSVKLRGLSGAKLDDGPHRSKFGSLTQMPRVTVSSKNEVSATQSYAWSELIVYSHKKIAPMMAAASIAWHFRVRKDPVIV